MPANKKKNRRYGYEENNKTAAFAGDMSSLRGNPNKYSRGLQRSLMNKATTTCKLI